MMAFASKGLTGFLCSSPCFGDIHHTMMTRRNLACLIGGAAVILLAGCEPGDLGSSRVYFDPIRYRLTAEVETPEGVRTGSSVIETIWDRGISGATVKGEAVAVDLPNGQTLFILLRTASNPDWAGGVPGLDPPDDAKPPTNADEREAEAGRQVAWIRANRDVHYLWGGNVPEERAQYLPYMVRFKDMKNPESVAMVAPNNLAEAFGPGYALKSLTVRITNDPVSMGIEKRLGWLGSYPEPRLQMIPVGGVIRPTVAQRLSHGDFIRK